MPEQQKEAEGGDERGGGGAEEGGGQIGGAVAASFLALPLLLCESPGAGSVPAAVFVVEKVGLERRERQSGVRGLVDASAASGGH